MTSENASALDWLDERYQSVVETRGYCRYCQQHVYVGSLPKEADQHLPKSMYACRCARFATVVFKEPFNLRQWHKRLKPLQTDRNKNLLGKNSKAKSPAKRKAKRRDKSATEPNSQAPVTLAPEASELSTDFAPEADSINQMHQELVSLGLTMLERMFQIGERLSRIKDQLPHGNWEQWIDDHLQFTSRTARRYIRAFKHRHDALATADPVLFLEEIQGKNEAKSDTTTKSDTGARFDQETPADSKINKQVRKRKVDRRNLSKHWKRATADAQEAIEELIDLQGQYDKWLGELSDELPSSELGDRLLAITQVELDDPLNAIKAAAAVELPHGFGKE